jgi:hypothetical protein
MYRSKSADIVVRAEWPVKREDCQFYLSGTALAAGVKQLDARPAASAVPLIFAIRIAV